MTGMAANEEAGVSESGGRGRHLVPTWLENLAELGWRVLVIVAFVIALAYLGSLIWNVVASIALAILVAVIMAPLVLKLRDGGRSRNKAAGIAWLVVIGVGLGLLLLLAVALLPYLVEIIDELQVGQAEVEEFVADLQLPTWLSTLVTDVIEQAEGISGDAVSDAVGNVANVAGIVILAVFLLFFFMRDGDKGWMWLFQWFGDTKRERITEAGDEALGRVGNYVRGTSIIAVIAAVTSWIFMLLLGTPLALPLALLTFITAYIPYFGGVIAAFFVVLITWGAAGSTAALIMVGLLLARYVIIHRFVRPRAFEHALTMQPALILIVLPVGLQIGGLAGLIVAVPLAAVLLSVAQALTDILRPDEPPELPELVPSWLDTAAQWSWRALVGLIFAGLLVVILTTLPLVVLPVILALIFAATILPLSTYFMRRGRSPNMASAIAVGGSTFAIVAVLALALVSLVDQAEEIGDTAVSGAETVDEAAGGYLGLGTEAIASGTDSGVQAILDVASNLASVTLVVVLSVLLTFYFLRDGARLWENLMSHVPADAAGELSAAGSRAFSVLSGYMVGTGAISLVGAASQALIMWLLGLPLVMPVFVLSFFGGYIPYIGSLLTTGLAFLIAVAVGDTIDVVIMAIWTVVFNLVQGNVVAPMVYNRTVHIHPAVTLAAIPAGSAVAGILGMFLVVPALGVLTETWRSILRIIGSDEDELLEPPKPSEPAADTPQDDPGARAPESA